MRTFNHVMLLCSYFNPKIGGIEKHVYYLVKGLLNEGYKVTVITSAKDPYIYARIPARRTKMLEIIPLHVVARPLNNPIQLGLTKKLLSADCDIIHVHDHYYYGSLIAALIKRIVKKPVVLTYHTSRLRFHNPLKNNVVKLYESTAVKYIFKQVDKIIVVVKSIIDDILKLGIELDKIVHIPNAIDPDEYRIIDSHLYRSFRLKYEFIVLFVGRLVERKGVHFLLKGFQLALQRKLIPNRSILLIVGDGPLKYILMKLARKLNIEDHVQFLGVVPQTTLNTLYAVCDVVIVPSISGETTSLVIQEAIINEKPFIASLVGGIVEYKEKGIWGIYTQPCNYVDIAKGLAFIHKIAHEIKDALRENKKKLLKEYSVKRMVTRTIEVYSEVYLKYRVAERDT